MTGVTEGLWSWRQDAIHIARAAGAEAPIVLLQPREVAWISHRRAIAAGLPHGRSISGHSAHGGTADHLISAGATTTQNQHVGGWRSAKMVRTYTRRFQRRR